MRRLRLVLATGLFAGFAVAEARAQAPDPEVQQALKDAMRTYPPGDYQSVIPKRESMLSTLVLNAKEDANPLRRKLKRIRFPKVELKDVSVVAALQWLTKESVELDPEREGAAVAVDLQLAAESNGNRRLDQTISLSLTNASLELALEFIDRLTNLHFDLEGNTVVVRPDK